jgi:hypothetical protein
MALNRLLPSTVELFIDGTFKTKHAVWDQVLHVTTIVEGDPTILYAAMMTKRTRGLYKETLKAVAGDLKEKLISVTSVNTDFEAGLMESGDRAFETGKIVGGRFHYSQVQIKKLQSLGIENFI